MRVLHAPVNIAGQAYVTARALRAIGVKAEAWTYSTAFHYPTDLDLGPLPSSRSKRVAFGLRLFRRAVAAFDIFHFHFGLSLLPGFMDLPLLKALGKKIVVEFWGSDVRKPSKALLRNPWSFPKEDDATIDARLRVWARYADAVVVADHELAEYVADYFRKVHVVRHRVWLDELEPVYPDPSCTSPVIVHAPSHRGVKGTEFVLAALDHLSKHHRVNAVLVEGRAHDEALRLISMADIVVDQLRIGTYGVLAVEAMALGKPVVVYIRDDLRSFYPASLPVISATPSTVKEVLERLVVDGPLRHRLGVMGRRYVEEYHDARKIAKELLRMYQGLLARRIGT